MKKRILALLIAVTTAFCLTCCGPATDDPSDTPDVPLHTHTYDESHWTYDENTHWHTATCEHFLERGSEAPHTMKDGICEVCGYSVVGMAVEEFTKNYADKAGAFARYCAGLNDQNPDTARVVSEFVWFKTDDNNKLTDMTYIYTIGGDSADAPNKLVVKTVKGINKTDLKEIASGNAGLQGQDIIATEMSLYSYQPGDMEKYMPLADAVYGVYVECYGADRYTPLLRLVHVASTDGEYRIDVLDILETGYARYLVKTSADVDASVDELIALVTSEEGISDHTDVSFKPVDGALVYQNIQG